MTEKKTLLAKEVKAEYGLSYYKLCNLVAERKIKRTRIGRNWYYPRRDIERVAGLA